MKPSISIAILLTVSLFTKIQANDLTEIQTLVNDACPPELQSGHYSKIQSIVSRLTDKSDWREALKASIYTSCFNEYPSWLAGHSFNLAIYGVKDGLKRETIEYMTELMGHKTMGKDDYVKTGRLIEKLTATGIHIEYLHQVIEKGVVENYSVEAHEAFTIAYLDAVNGGKRHEDAMMIAEKTIGGNIHSTSEVTLLSSVFPKEDPVETAGVKQGIQERQAQVELQKEIFWGNVEKSIRQRPTYHIPNGGWNTDRLLHYVETWIGTPYLYGGYSHKGIDCSGFVLKVMLDQFKEAKLPRTANQLSGLGQKVNKSSLKPGDLIFFSATKSSKKITHVGIYIGNDTFAHASSSRGVTKSSISKQYYQDRFISARRLFY